MHLSLQVPLQGPCRNQCLGGFISTIPARCRDPRRGQKLARLPRPQLQQCHQRQKPGSGPSLRSKHCFSFRSLLRLLRLVCFASFCFPFCFACARVLSLLPQQCRQRVVCEQSRQPITIANGSHVLQQFELCDSPGLEPCHMEPAHQGQEPPGKM